MRLYIRKAVAQINTTAVETKDEDREAAEYEDSFTKQPVGVASGEETEEETSKTKVGKRWSGGEPQSDVVRQKQDEKARKDTDAHLVDTKKSLNAEACDMLKSISANFQEAYEPSSVEIEFMTEVLGYDRGEVLKGLHMIVGKDRDLFQDWVCDRMNKSITNLIRSVR